MKEQLNKILSTFSEFWKSQEKKRKILYISVLAAVVLFAVILTIVLNTKHYVVLYDGLESTEAAEIVNEIQTLGVDANVSADGKITVPEDQQDSMRMQLGVKGYPKSSLNYDVWNTNVDMFTTDTEKREQARMQLQERLIATIETLAGVDKAIVTLDIPEQKDTVINVNAQPSKASVVLHLKKDVALTDDQLNGIKHIVLTSVSGLTEENISITDGTGKLLEVGKQDERDVVTIEREKLRFKQEYQNAIKEEVLSLFLPAYGENGVKVSVNADLNYDKKVSENTKYTPSHDDGSAMIQNENTKNASGTNGTDGGVVGVEPNADDTYPTGTEGDTGAWSQNERSTSYLVNTLKEQIEKQGYDIDTMSVSVMVYTDLLSDDQKQTLTAAAAMAAGTKEEFVSVGNIPKLTDDAAANANLAYPFGWTQSQFFAFVAVLIVLIIIFMALYLSVSKRARRKRRAIEREIMAAAQLAGENGQVDGFFNAGEKVEVASLTENATVETKESAVRREISEFAKNSPEIVAQLLKSWLREEADNNGGSGRSSGGGGRGSRR